MGIRMLNHRPAAPRTLVGEAPDVTAPSVPAFATGASTARVPAGLATALRRAVAGLRRRSDPADPQPWHLWADLTRGYLALLLNRLPQPDPSNTVTVFVAAPAFTADGPSGRPAR
ncbi:hypothetical protein [Streptomyces sp. NPDC046985]|uniref:hypothetical protein n=1 Tax=Streptomyces sp. NPDC046985 TaxID=3155377 RepID=UPI0033C7334A